MMSDIFTVAWKEWREFRDQIFRLKKGGLSAVIVVLMLGIFTPLQMGKVWITSRLMLAYWPLLASGMVSTLIADAFAGERERHTLESLLATRLPDSAILIGKVLAAIAYGLLFTFANLLVGYVVLNIKHFREGPVLPPFWNLVSIIVLVVLACATLSGAGVFISLKASTVRQAQQTLGVIMMVVFVAPVVFIQMLGREGGVQLALRLSGTDMNRVVWWAMGALAIAALALNLMALARFKRGKLVLD